MMLVLICFAACLLLISNAEAATFNAASCSLADVQTTANAAGNGDTVSIPAGNCTWTSALTVSAGVTLQGSGTLQTAITGNNTSSYYILNGSGPSSTYPFRVTNIYFKLNQNYSFYLLGWFRMDHNKFEAVSGWVKGFLIPSTHALLDNNQFINVGWQVNGSQDKTANDALWAAGPQWGTENAVYFEDNTITQVDQNVDMDCNYAGRVVYRYNTVTGMFGNHGGEIGSYRGCQNQEIYNNTIVAPTNSPPQSSNTAVQFRGGTGMVYNNIIDNGSNGSFNNWILFQDYCSTISYHPCAASQRCGPSPGPYSYPCTDQVGFGAGPWGSQTSYPIYMWNNCSGSLGCGTGAGNRDPVVENVDYQTAHIRSGVDYFSRTEGTLHGYTPYTYPHPLRAGGGALLAAPGNLRVTQ